MLTFFVHSTVIGVDDKGDEIQCVLHPLSVLLNLFWVMDHSGWQLQVRVKFTPLQSAHSDEIGCWFSLKTVQTENCLCLQCDLSK